jgi:hypothetical protein
MISKNKFIRLNHKVLNCWVLALCEATQSEVDICGLKCICSMILNVYRIELLHETGLVKVPSGERVARRRKV